MDINFEQLGAQTIAIIVFFGGIIGAILKWPEPVKKIFKINWKKVDDNVCPMHSGITSAITSLTTMQDAHFQKAEDFYKDSKEHYKELTQRIDAFMLAGQRVRDHGRR